MEGTSQKIYLYVYDLTQGMAKSLAPMLIGRPLEGVWHSGIVAFGSEYFFGDGICNMPPGTTPFGSPTKKILLGESEINQELFHEYLSDLKGMFSPTTYNVKKNNCNHFTNECCNFLVGSDIPHDILKQAEDLFNTPLGKMVEPMMMQQQDALKQGSNNMFGGQQTESLGGSMNSMSLAANKGPADGKKLVEVKSLAELQDLIHAYPGVIIDCWRPTCPPCMKFKPIYAQMAELYGSDKVKFVTANTQEAPEVGMNLMVTSIPAFFIYKNGECVDQFVGANKAKLEESVKKLKTDIGDDGSFAPGAAPKQPAVIRLKQDLGFIQFKPYSIQAILFENVVNMSKIGVKINEIVSSIEGDELADLKSLLEDFKMAGLNDQILQQLLIATQKCDEKDIFALFDFLRCWFIIENLAKAAVSSEWENLEKCLIRLESLSEGEAADISKQVTNAQMTATQACCNLFKFESAYKVIVEDPAKLIRLLTFSGKMLNSSKDKAISAAASVALNWLIEFDQLVLKKIEEDKEQEYEDKIKQLAEKFEAIEEGVRSYCESATKVYQSLDNSDALFRLIMSEWRLLHSNFKIVEQFAGDDEFLRNRMRITQKYPSGQLNESVSDLQKIMGSYIK